MRECVWGVAQMCGMCVGDGGCVSAMEVVCLCYVYSHVVFVFSVRIRV